MAEIVPCDVRASPGSTARRAGYPAFVVIEGSIEKILIEASMQVLPARLERELAAARVKRLQTSDA